MNGIGYLFWCDWQHFGCHGHGCPALILVAFKTAKDMEVMSGLLTGYHKTGLRRRMASIMSVQGIRFVEIGWEHDNIDEKALIEVENFTIADYFCPLLVEVLEGTLASESVRFHLKWPAERRTSRTI
jgi:hypothetical protein